MSLASGAPFTQPTIKWFSLELYRAEVLLDGIYASRLEDFRSLYFADISNSLGSGSQAPTQKLIRDLVLGYTHQSAISHPPYLLSETELSNY